MSKKLLTPALGAFALALAAFAVSIATHQIPIAHAQGSMRASIFRIVDSRNADRLLATAAGTNEVLTLLAMYDPNQRERLRFKVFPDGRTPSIEFLDTGGRVVSTLPATSRLAPPTHRAGESEDGKADSASSADAEFLQRQIDDLTRQLAELKSRNNLR